MKALRPYNHNHICYEDIVEPQLWPGWSIVELGWTSFCKSDLESTTVPSIPVQKHRDGHRAD
jgi:hypothetical protein